MRRYEIVITDQDGKPKVVKGSNGETLFNGTFTSTGSIGSVFGGIGAANTPIAGALEVEFDIPVSTYNSPLGGASLRIYGVGLPLISQAANFNPSQDGKTYCNIKISVGMAEGLPLANPKQYGVVLNARIQQAFGNWQGTSQTLDLIMIQPAGSKESPFNFSFKCPKGQPLAAAIKNTLQDVFKNATAINVNISPNLISPEDITVQNFTLTDFNKFLNKRSISIIGGTSYPGIQISYVDNIINVYDYTVPSTTKPISLAFTDLIGQPTWIAPYILTFKTVMRYDLKVGGLITMPQQSAQKGLILTAPASQSQYKEVVNFQGTFFIQNVRHLGIFRSPDANSWVTVVQAYNKDAGSIIK
jgi:hypothetical protein